MEKLLLKRTPLIVFSFLSVLLFAAWGISAAVLTNRGMLYILYSIIYIVLILSMMIAYKKEETNCQKVLISSMLMFFARDHIDICEYDFTHIEKLSTVEIIIDAIIAVCIVLLLINYILSLSDHIGHQALTTASNILLVLICVTYISSFAVKAIEGCKLNGWLLSISELVYVLLFSCIQTRVQIYKRIRAQAKKDGSWNEESRQKAKKIFALN